MSDSPAQKSVDEPHSSRASSNSVDLPPQPEVITNDFNSHHHRPDDQEEDTKEKHPIDEEPEIIKEEYAPLDAVDRDHAEEKQMQREKEEAALAMQQQYEEKERMNRGEEEGEEEAKENESREDKADEMDKEEQNREHDKDEPSSSSAAADTNNKQISLYIGLGPAARDIRVDDFRRFLQTQASAPELIGDIRMRGRCAFVDIGNLDEAQRLIAQLHNEMYEDRCRMTVQLSRSRGSRPSRLTSQREGPYGGSTYRRPFREMERRDRYETGNSRPSHEYNGDGHPSLFIGLGPNGIHIPDHVIRQKLEDCVPILAFRRHGQCAFVDVQDDYAADKLIREVSNQYIDEARISVQFSRDNRKRRRTPPPRGGYADRDHDGFSSSSRSRRESYGDSMDGRYYYGKEANRDRYGGGGGRGGTAPMDNLRGEGRYYGVENPAVYSGRTRRQEVIDPSHRYRRTSPAYSDHGRRVSKGEYGDDDYQEEEYYRSRKDDRNRYYDDKAYPARREAYNSVHRTQDYKHRHRSRTPPLSNRYQTSSSSAVTGSQGVRHHTERHTRHRSPSRSLSRSRSKSSRYSRSSRSYSSRSRSMTPPRRGMAGGSGKNESKLPAESAMTSMSTNIGGGSVKRENNSTRRRSYSPSSRHSSMERDRNSRRGIRAAPRRV